MKKTKLIAMLGIATFATAVLGGTIAQAADLTDTTTGSVEFIQGDETIVDPTKPGPDPKPVTPPPTITVPPVTGPEGNSTMYIFANLDFGVHKVTPLAATYSSIQLKSDGWKGNDGIVGGLDAVPAANGKVLPQFIQLQMNSDAKATDLKASLGEFKLEGGTKVLKATNVAFTNVKMQSNSPAGTETAVPNFTLVPAATASNTLVTTFAAPTGEGGSIQSVIFGEMTDGSSVGKGGGTIGEGDDKITLPTTTEDNLNKTTGNADNDNIYYNNGIQLNLPAGSNMKEGEKYQADLTWTISNTL